MSEVQGFRERLGEKLKEKSQDAHAVEAELDVNIVTFDWLTLLATLFPLLLDLLQGCLSNRSEPDVVNSASCLTWIERWALWRSIRRDDGIPKAQRRIAFEAAVETLEESTPEQIKSGVEEFHTKTREWGLFD